MSWGLAGRESAQHLTAATAAAVDSVQHTALEVDGIGGGAVHVELVTAATSQIDARTALHSAACAYTPENLELDFEHDGHTLTRWFGVADYVAIWQVMCDH